MNGEKRLVVATGIVGLVAAIMTGTGEFLLHYDPLNRYAEGLDYLADVSAERANIGHFLGSLGAPLYLIGTLHLYWMLRSANQRWAAALAMILAYSFAIAAIWLGSRATLHSLAVSEPSTMISMMRAQYELRYETLLNFARAGVLLVSIIYAWLIVRGPSPYPRWMAIANPILLIAGCFAVWFVIPAVGKFIMPIALNVAFTIIFALSVYFASRRFGEGLDQ